MYNVYMYKYRYFTWVRTWEPSGPRRRASTCAMDRPKTAMASTDTSSSPARAMPDLYTHKDTHTHRHTHKHTNTHVAFICLYLHMSEAIESSDCWTLFSFFASQTLHREIRLRLVNASQYVLLAFASLPGDDLVTTKFTAQLRRGKLQSEAFASSTRNSPSYMCVNQLVLCVCVCVCVYVCA
jgi:hypothetical protein